MEARMGLPPSQTPLHTAMAGMFKNSDIGTPPTPSLAPSPPAIAPLLATLDDEDSSISSTLWSWRMPAPQTYTPPIAISWVPSYDESQSDSLDTSVAPTVRYTLSTPWPTQNVVRPPSPNASARKTPPPTPDSRFPYATTHPADSPASLATPAPGLVDESESPSPATALNTISPSQGGRGADDNPSRSAPAPASATPATEGTDTMGRTC